MTLIDTSVIVAWLDPDHEHHDRCRAALEKAALEDEIAISTVTYSELASGGRTRDFVDDKLAGFTLVPLDADSAWRAGMAFRQFRPGKGEQDPVLPDFFIRGTALQNNWPHLTNDRRFTKVWTGLDLRYP